MPAVDKFMKEFLDKRFPKEEDGELAKIQAATLLPICPLAFPWNSFLESGADKDPDMLVPVADVISMIQRTICLIGNASEFISQIRRTRILEKLDVSWSKYGQEDFSDSKDTLLGKNSQQTLASKVEEEAVLAKAVVASKCSKERRPPAATERKAMVTVSFFVEALLPGTGADKARIYSHTTQAKRRKVATIRGDTSQAHKKIDTKGQLAYLVLRGQSSFLAQALSLAV